MSTSELFAKYLHLQQETKYLWIEAKGLKEDCRFYAELKTDSTSVNQNTWLKMYEVSTMKLAEVCKRKFRASGKKYFDNNETLR